MDVGPKPINTGVDCPGYGRPAAGPVSRGWQKRRDLPVGARLLVFVLTTHGS